MSHYSWPCQVQKKCAHHVKNPCLRRLYYSRVDYFPIINPMYLSFRSFFSSVFSRKQFCLGSDTTSQWVENIRIFSVPNIGAKIQIPMSNLSILILARKFKDLRLYFDVNNSILYFKNFFLDFYQLCKVLSILILNLNLLAKQNISEKPF